jgi:hypothetical protein
MDWDESQSWLRRFGGTARPLHFWTVMVKFASSTSIRPGKKVPMRQALGDCLRAHTALPERRHRFGDSSGFHDCREHVSGPDTVDTRCLDCRQQIRQETPQSLDFPCSYVIGDL